VETRDRWIQNAVDAIATIHACGIVHSDISPRNFLVTDHLSIQLCDFAGSRINDLHSLVEEETRYRLPLSPSSPRTAITDLFALDSFIYEISTGTSPFPDLDDDEIERRYASQVFPSLDSLEYHTVISKCWKSQYSSADMLKGDIRHLRKPCTFDTE
jgi:serine/threonine protein kinase